MRAIILAAGMGSRLRPITLDVPKCLVQVAGRPILDWQLSAFELAGVTDVTVVAGYRARQVEDFCNRRPNRAGVHVITNLEYEGTNNLYSLTQALRRSHEPCFICNGDVVFDPRIVQQMIHGEPNLIAVVPNKYIDESMKVVVRDGRIRAISKGITPDEAYGVSIDVYKFDTSTLRAVEEYAQTQFSLGIRNQWTEVAIDAIADSAALIPFDIGPARWVEIDTHEDLADAERLFG